MDRWIGLKASELEKKKVYFRIVFNNKEKTFEPNKCPEVTKETQIGSCRCASQH